MFLKVGKWDDGAIAEGFSESTSVLLAEHWEHLPEGASWLRTDAAFRQFVEHHIDSSVPDERLQRIIRSSAEECPVGLDDVCRSFGMRAQLAKQD